MFKFLTNRPLWVNILAAIALVLLILFIFLQLLGMITKHGDYLTVPSVVGKPTPEAIKFLEGKGFEVVIQDSVYIDTAKRGIVLKQLPDPSSTVKVNRTVFLTVNRVTLPAVEMPALKDKSLSYALMILEHSHLKLGDTTYKPDYTKGSVLSQLFNGNEIAPGTKIPWGSSIDLVISGGLSEDKFLVPGLVGRSFGDAKALLEATGISMGAVISMGTISDTATAFVIKQSPPQFTDSNEPMYIKSGQLLDLYISQVMPTDSTTNK